MNDATYQDYYVTVRHDEGRTEDFKVTARNAYAARAQHLQRHPGARVIAVRLEQR